MTARHSCKVPRDRSRIRVMRSGLTRQQAIDWEIFYIARYGRKDLGTGCLVNRTPGGDLCEHSPEVRQRLSEAGRRRENVERLRRVNIGRAMHPNTRAAILAATAGKKRPAHVVEAVRQAHLGKKKSPEQVAKQVETRERRSAERLGLPYETWAGMSSRERNTLRMWVVNNPGSTGEEYLTGKRRRHGVKPKIDAELVRQLRGEGLSQTEIARRLGCAASYVSRILSGKRQGPGVSLA